MVEKIALYKTKDGRTFHNRKDAERHEYEQVLTLELTKHLSESLSSGRRESICLQMLVNAPQVIETLRKYTRKYPQPK